MEVNFILSTFSAEKNAITVLYIMIHRSIIQKIDSKAFIKKTAERLYLE